jgi:hypothetical protein
MLAASTSSFGLSASSPAFRAPCSGPRRAASASGDEASGSGIKISIPIASGRAAPVRSISSAMRVRGHGHWPKARTEASSMLTMITGADVRWRGMRIW